MATLERARPTEEELVSEVPSRFPSHELAALRDEDDHLHHHTTSTGDSHLPPSYDDQPYHPHPPHDDHLHHHSRTPSASIPPTYPHEERPSYDSMTNEYPQDKPSSSNEAESSSSSQSAEKRRLDLDSVTAAIFRLYEVAPQLGDQRVELNDKKRDELELARMVGRGRMTDQQATDTKGKQAERRNEQELAKIWESIEHAHGRRLDQQEATSQPSTSASASRERDSKRQAFMEDLVARTSAGRMHGQDCSPSSPLTANSPSGSYVGERQDLITVGQFIKELGAESEPRASPATASTSTPPSASARRSSFVPAFVGSIGRRASIKQEPTPAQDSLPDAGSSSRPSPRSGAATATQDRQTQHGYVAELQESIRVIQIHLKLDDPPGSELKLAVPTEGATEVRVSSSAHGWEAVVPLPGPAVAFVGKVITSSSGSATRGSVASFRLSSLPTHSESATALCSDPPLSAPELAALEPACLACTTCATPIVDTAAVVRSNGFKDLPSEHWEELVGSWLCHDEMKLALGASGEEGGGSGAPQGGNGFWPKESEVLVGSNYVLVQGALLFGGEQNTSQTWRVRVGAESETWQPVECMICSSSLGRRMGHPSVPPTSTFKLSKYAVSPRSASKARLSDLPLSVFLAADFLELADVHRCYHFVVHAEEDPSKPLILIWLLNPSIHITLSSCPAPFRASKLMFRSSPLPEALPPAFDAGEPLYYPSSICAKLAEALEASHAAYPGSSAGGMMGLKGGWLERHR